jgi:dTDP-4-dehydrorhamnose reductase
MLAWDLVRTFRKQFSVESVLALGRGELDITSKESIRSVFSAVRPTWVFNTAAYTSVDGAEGEKEKAEAINAEGPAFLADACRASGARLVHFGTDQVFDGRAQAPRTEAEIPVPSNHYAATKLRGEQAVLQNKGNLVLRVQWLYGEKKDRFSVLRQKKEFSPFSDQVGAPTWTREIARALCVLLHPSTLSQR